MNVTAGVRCRTSELKAKLVEQHGVALQGNGIYYVSDKALLLSDTMVVRDVLCGSGYLYFGTLDMLEITTNKGKSKCFYFADDSFKGGSFA